MKPEPYHLRLALKADAVPDDGVPGSPARWVSTWTHSTFHDTPHAYEALTFADPRDLKRWVSEQGPTAVALLGQFRPVPWLWVDPSATALADASDIRPLDFFGQPDDLRSAFLAMLAARSVAIEAEARARQKGVALAP